MKILEKVGMTNKEYAARLLNSVANKLLFVKDHINANVDDEIIHNEILICRDMIDNLIKNITIED